MHQHRSVVVEGSVLHFAFTKSVFGTTAFGNLVFQIFDRFTELVGPLRYPFLQPGSMVFDLLVQASVMNRHCQTVSKLPGNLYVFCGNGSRLFETDIKRADQFPLGNERNVDMGADTFGTNRGHSGKFRFIVNVFHRMVHPLAQTIGIAEC